MFGKRDGVLQGFAVISTDKANQFRNTPGWKQGVVHNIQMLARSEMYKPSAVPLMPLFLTTVFPDMIIYLTSRG